VLSLPNQLQAPCLRLVDRAERLRLWPVASSSRVRNPNRQQSAVRFVAMSASRGISAAVREMPRVDLSPAGKEASRRIGAVVREMLKVDLSPAEREAKAEAALVDLAVAEVVPLVSRRRNRCVVASQPPQARRSRETQR
jgi:hypothetical protein